MSRPLAYWHSGGDMMFAGGTLSHADIACLRELYLDEARAAEAAGDGWQRALALTLAAELSAAAEAARRWSRASVRHIVLWV